MTTVDEPILKHPDLQPGQAFLMNVLSLKHFDEIDWLTKRPGKQAYDDNGKKTGGVPVFVNGSEALERGFFITTEGEVVCSKPERPDANSLVGPEAFPTPQH